MFDIPPGITDDEDSMTFNELRCIVSLQFLELHLWNAQNGTFYGSHAAKCLPHIGEYVASDMPWADYVKVAYEHFIQVLETNRNIRAPQKNQLEHNYAARSASVMSAAKSLKETLRQYR